MNAQSFDQANRLVGLLADEPTYVKDAHVRRLRKAQKDNRQVESARHVDFSLTRIEQKLGMDAGKSSNPENAPSYFEEEPF